MNDETPRFRLIKGGRLSFSTDHLFSIDAILRERLQPISRYGWVLEENGSLVSSCGGPVTELTTRIGEMARSLASTKRVVTGLSVPLPPPETLACPLVAVQIEPMGLLVATSAGEPLPADYEATLVRIADLLGTVFEAARERVR